MPTKYQSDQQAADNLADALMDLPEKWVMCRDVRHAWDVMNDFHVTSRAKKQILTIGRTLQCLRCETLRNEVYVHGAYGLEKVTQNYVYPEHYQIKGVPRGVKPQSIIQAEQYRRSMEKIAKMNQKKKVS